MKKIVRLTESDLVRIVKRVISEQEDEILASKKDKTPIGMCQVVKGGNPLLKTTNLGNGPDNIIDDIYEGGTGKLYTEDGEQLEYFGTNEKFAIVKKDNKLGYTLKDYVNCKVGSQGGALAQNESYRRRYRY